MEFKLSWTRYIKGSFLGLIGLPSCQLLVDGVDKFGSFLDYEGFEKLLGHVIENGELPEHEVNLLLIEASALLPKTFGEFVEHACSVPLPEGGETNLAFKLASGPTAGVLPYGSVEHNGQNRFSIISLVKAFAMLTVFDEASKDEVDGTAVLRLFQQIVAAGVPLDDTDLIRQVMLLPADVLELCINELVDKRAGQYQKTVPFEMASGGSFPMPNPKPLQTFDTHEPAPPISHIF